jgi:serine phosphatase RsbU (regulator of sigma subunit)
VLSALTDELRSILHIRSITVVTLHGTRGDSAILAGDDIPSGQLQSLAAQPGLLERLEHQDVVVLGALAGVSPEWQTSTVFPIAQSDGELVTVVFGERESGKPLSTDELSVLDSVARHTALGWKNAAVTEEMRAQERLKKEIEIAHSIQAAMLPSRMPDLPGYDVAAESHPAREMGGDFFDFLPTAQDRFAVILGDVSDKGVSAAMVMASSVSSLRFAAEQEREPREALAVANHRLFLDTQRHMFVAALFGVLDVGTGEFVFTNAGLPKPLLHRGGEGYLIDWSENGLHVPLGMRNSIEFHQQSLTLEHGDILVLYTDGVIESRNAQDEEFDVKRLRDVVRRLADASAGEILDGIRAEVAAFSGKVEPFDDITIIVLKPT